MTLVDVQTHGPALSAPGAAPADRPIVRPALPEDLDSILALVAAAGLPTAGIAGCFPYGYVVAESGGLPVAAAGVEIHGGAGLLRSVAVEPAYRGRGLGSALVGDRLAWARERGLGTLYLLTETSPGFFRGLGFAPVARDEVPAVLAASEEFAEICPQSAQAMSIALEGAAGHSGEALREKVREKYGEAARAVREGRSGGCCASSCCGGGAEQRNPVTSDLYGDEVEGLPPTALAASLGCGNPTALAELNPGEVVLDLGSGGGIDVLLSARRVGPSGRAYGLDMTDEMLELARENARRAGAENVEFLRGEIEAVPLPNAAVDVVISNCVINLAADKRRVLAEAFRVLRPGGRFAVSDVVLRERLPEEAQRNLALWIGCVAGALEESEYRRLLAEVGFAGIEVEPTRIYRAEDARAFLGDTGLDPGAAEALDAKVMSAFVRATKPVAS